MAKGEIFLKKSTLTLLLFFSAILFLTFSYKTDSASSDVARIHVIANSDSERDVEIKMAVSEEVKRILKNETFDSLESIKEGLENKISDIEENANKVLSKMNADYTAKVTVDYMYFDKKSLGNESFDEGEYLAMIVKLGKGEGHNWWSVIFPDISFGASLAQGEQGFFGKTVILGGGNVVKIRSLALDLIFKLKDAIST